MMPESVAWSLIASLFLALVGSLGYREHKRRERFTQAADAFRAAFLPAITRLDTELGCHRNILNEEFREQEKAAIAFRQHLGRRLARFNEAWQAYEAYAKEQTDVPLLAFLGTEVLDLNRANDPAHVREVAEMRKKECFDYINPLLEFAEPK
jgi:hypothetical protein